MNSLMVCVPRCSRIACWPSTQASCRAHGAPSPQARSSMMQRATPNGPSTVSTASRSVILFAGRASREPPPRPCSVSTRPAWESLARMRASRRRGNVGFGGDPVGGHPLTDPGKIHQSPQSVPPFATQLQLQTYRLLWREYLSAPITQEHYPLMRTSLPRAVSSTTRLVMICEE